MNQPDREAHLKQRLADLQAEYRQHAQPIIDELVRIESSKPPPPLIIQFANLPESVREAFQKLAIQ